MLETSDNTFDIPNQQNYATTRLSCSNCRQRKIKCNKTIPCLHCHTSGRECVYPQRVRRRAGQASKPREDELMVRIKNLEGLVGRITATAAPTDKPDPKEEYGPSSVEPGAINIQPSSNARLDDESLAFVKQQESGSQYVGHTLWTMLSQEVGGLRQLLEDTAEEDEQDYVANHSPDTTYSSQILLNCTGMLVEPDHPSELHKAILIQFYFSNVHPLCKLLHGPTIKTLIFDTIRSETPKCDIPTPSSVEAIAFAMYFAAVTSMSDDDCLKLLETSKADLVVRYKSGVEIALSRANFLSSNEITTLQGLTLYIMALRSHNLDRSSWTLIATAVRIAHALGLHRDGDGRAFSPFDGEMRRRLWWQIFILDMRASEDRGSEVMILDGSFNTAMPHNLNDDDFGIQSLILPPSRDGFTEMAFPLICMDASIVILKISFIPPFKERKVLTFAQKEELVKECTERIDSYVRGASPSDPYGWVARTIGQILVLKQWLVMQYPLQCVYSTSQHFSKGQSLRTAIAFLNICELLEQTKEAERFLWFLKTYVPWHALAVALAELCKENSGPLADQAWDIINKGFAKWGARMADSQEGILWRPVKSLMKKAQAARERGKIHAQQPMGNSSGSISTPPTGNDNFGEGEYSPQRNRISSADPVSLYNFDSLLPEGYPSLGVDTSDLLDSLQLDTDLTNNTSANWEYWNEFLFDVDTAHNDFYEP